MNPFFFGSSTKRLFGVYHPPKGQTIRSEGIVLCYPFGMEYMRSHRAFRQLALMLSKKGFHVFRFDYYGSGDSGGEGEEVTVEQWVEDINTAVDELKDTATIDKITLVGLRLGAALAHQVSLQRSDIDQLVLWDPVVTGEAYVHELLQHFLEESPDSPIEGTIGINGFPLTKVMRDNFKQIDLLSADQPKSESIYYVVSNEREEFTQLKDSLEKLPVKSTYNLIPTEGNWNEVDNFGGVLLPQEIIQSIIAWLE